MEIVRGTIALIGSGELSGTMVETHKKLLSQSEYKGKSLFLDTPAGFQENVDLIARRAVQYFQNQVGENMRIASFKSSEMIDLPEGEKVLHDFSEAGYVLIGPGSPSYTVKNLETTPIPSLLSAMVARGGCLVVASAAALTVGSHTIPVYEIYKVGEKLHWVKGLNILGHLGLEVVVVPHWNNAEGGNHDTRFCYMGEKRFRILETILPQGATILGLDEHTACILNFSSREAMVEGLGQVTIRRDGEEQHFDRYDRIAFYQLQGKPSVTSAKGSARVEKRVHSGGKTEPETSFWDRMHEIENSFQSALEQNDSAAMATMLLEADRQLWQAQLDLENPEFISQGREIFREMIVLAGTGFELASKVIPRKFNDLVNHMIELREEYRKDKQWIRADQVRSLLQKVGVVLEDTEEGPRWHL